jgi:surfeit locus 1 family protein
LTARLRVFVAVAAIAAAVFIRLGVWQLHRRDERRARNAIVRARLDSAPVDVRALPRDTALTRFRRVRVAGTPDYGHELIAPARTHRGSPGVNVLTPVRLPGTDTAVLVNRGWVYSPDAATIDAARWREADSVFLGYVDALPRTRGTLPYPSAPFQVVVMGDTDVVANRPIRLGLPALDDGPHLSYAIQWFGFALVALGGSAVVVRRARGSEDAY